jgi:hypothetical protein
MFVNLGLRSLSKSVKIRTRNTSDLKAKQPSARGNRMALTVLKVFDLSTITLNLFEVVAAFCAATSAHWLPVLAKNMQNARPLKRLEASSEVHPFDRQARIASYLQWNSSIWLFVQLVAGPSAGFCLHLSGPCTMLRRAAFVNLTKIYLDAASLASTEGTRFAGHYQTIISLYSVTSILEKRTCLAERTCNSQSQ